MRKWIFRHSGGVPYVYASDIQDHLLECTEYKEEVDSEGLSIDEWDDFLKSHAEQRPNSSTKFPFNRIYLFIYLFINLFKVGNDKRDTVYKNTHKIAKG